MNKNTSKKIKVFKFQWEVKINSKDQTKDVGEILVRGENVMVGYYKNEEATSEAIDKDGWLHTGDLGLIDKDGFIYIKGRSKSMILGASGQNIYPEEIESIINNRSFVGSSVVKLQDNKLIAMVFPDPDRVKESGITREELIEKLERYRIRTNDHLPSYMRVSKFIIHEEDFEKTTQAYQLLKECYKAENIDLENDKQRELIIVEMMRI